MKTRTNTLFQLRKFLILWITQAVSELGSAMTSFALILWAYEQQGTASSIAMLSICTYLPSVLFSFLAGTLTDTWDKKKIMLASDLIAACGTATVFLLYRFGDLRIWHLYMVNILISFMNAFQNPASYVAVSVLAPKEQYTKVGGMQALSNSLVTILAPVFATAVRSFAGMEAVFSIDLGSFAFAFIVLALFIKLPPIPVSEDHTDGTFWKNCLSGLRFLRKHQSIWRLILFFSVVNLLCSMAGNNIMPAMILARTGGNQLAVGMVSSALGIGTLVGSLLTIVLRPPKNRIRLIFFSCAISFALCDVLWGLGRNPAIWVFAAFAGNLPLPFLNANLTTIMRTHVPIDMQGRVFAARDTFQYITIPIGLALGGVLSDHVFEPFMAHTGTLQQILSQLVGIGKGSGMAVLFLMIGIVGCVMSFACYHDPIYRELMG